MRLYLTTFIDDEKPDGLEQQAAWQGTQVDARKARDALKAAMMRDVHTEEVDVPTDKAGLLAFLNNGSKP